MLTQRLSHPQEIVLLAFIWIIWLKHNLELELCHVNQFIHFVLVLWTTSNKLILFYYSAYIRFVNILYVNCSWPTKLQLLHLNYSAWIMKLLELFELTSSLKAVQNTLCCAFPIFKSTFEKLLILPKNQSLLRSPKLRCQSRNSSWALQLMSP